MERICLSCRSRLRYQSNNRPICRARKSVVTSNFRRQRTPIEETLSLVERRRLTSRLDLNFPHTFARVVVFAYPPVIISRVKAGDREVFAKAAITTVLDVVALMLMVKNNSVLNRIRENQQQQQHRHHEQQQR